MIKLADRHLVEKIPVLHAIVGHVKTAVAADDHVPAVARVDPQGVLIIVDAPAAIRDEGLAAVRGPERTEAANVDTFVVAGIDADLAEIHRPRVEAVDPRPGVAPVDLLVNAAVLVTVLALEVLHVFALAAQEGGILAGRPARADRLPTAGDEDF